MTQEEKQLLLVDLCARLPYWVICTDNIHGDGRISNIDINLSSGEVFVYFWDFDEDAKIENIKPYLRPMSSMTEEEVKEFTAFASQSQHRFFIGDTYYWYNNYEEENWLNKNMFDYRGLIERGLALEAPEGMYKMEE